MAERMKVTNKRVEEMPPQTILRDVEVGGFFARRQNGTDVVYSVAYRTKHDVQRTARIGTHGSEHTADSARKRAREIRALVAAGGDPAGERYEDRKAATVAQLCADYLKEAASGRILTKRKIAKKASTVAVDECNIRNHILPLLGSLKVAAVTRRDIEKFQTSVTEGKTARKAAGPRGGGQLTGGQGAATRTMGLLGAIFQFAVKRDLRGDNPVRGVERHADGRRNRRVDEAEYAALGEALRTMPDTVWPLAVTAARFLAVTGWRRGEMLELRWSEVDLAARTANLVDTKTGASMRPLSRAACDLLRDLPRQSKLVFPSARGVDEQMSGFHKVWIAIAKRAGLPADVTPHVLRHSFASVAADLGYSELTIASLIGHRLGSVTSRYTHTADAVLLAAADAVARSIEDRLGYTTKTGVVIDFKSVA